MIVFSELLFNKEVTFYKLEFKIITIFKILLVKIASERGYQTLDKETKSTLDEHFQKTKGRY